MVYMTLSCRCTADDILHPPISCQLSFPATPSQRAIPVQPGQAAAQAVAAGTSAAPPTAKQNLASTPPNNPVWYNQGGTPVATARTTLTPRVSQGDIDHGVSDCIHSLTHLDFEALADSLRLKIDYVKWCLTDPANISKLTIAQIRLCVKYVSDKFKITYKSPYLKYQWVALLESMLFKSRVVKEPENVINSPYQVRFNNATASPSTPTPALPSVPRFEGTPKTPVPRAPGVPAATTPRFQPFTPNAQNPLAASSTPTKTISFPIRLLCEAKPILTKLYQRLKMIPSEFGSFYDFVGLLDAKD
ncbi:hypothetical protein BC829DRAFT_259928 [Chytridium lagenaria]|nr:hypothetical protein BC829DRAFT_259928 [Chytridium lagenaria]